MTPAEVGAPGVVAMKLFCGDAEHRPLANALSQGGAVSASVARPATDGTIRLIHVRISDPTSTLWVVTTDGEYRQQ